MRKKAKQRSPYTEQPLVAHLVELRDRLIRAVIAVAVVFVALVPFANPIYTFAAKPLLLQLPPGASMIATEVASPLFTPFKLTMIVAVILAMPIVLYQIWAFVAPGLYRHEQRLMAPLLISSSVLFYAGVAFAYFVVFPIVFGFFATTAPEGVTVMTDISKYLDFVLAMFLAFGVVFEIPVATILLIRMDIVSRQSLVNKRPYFIVFAFVVGMLLTPPDVVSQTLLAIPMIVLFEAGLLVAKFIEPKEREEGGVSDADADSRADADASAPASVPQGAVVAAADVENLDEEFDRAEEQERALQRGTSQTRAADDP